MPFQEVYNATDPKKIDLIPDKTEVGTKEDLGTNVSWELAHNFQAVEEKSDAKPKEPQVEKSVTEIQADINSFREQIKIGETKDASGHYNEKLVLENEAKLRAAEQLLTNKQNQAKNETELAALREEIKGYRENIKLSETKDASGHYNEKLVLENEAKLRAAENKISPITTTEKFPPTNTEQSVAPTIATAEKPINKEGLISPKKNIFSRIFSFGRK